MKKFELEAPMAKAGIATAERFTLEIDQYYNCFMANMINRIQRNELMRVIKACKSLTSIKQIGTVELFD